MKKKMAISFSGGRTSAYMTKWLLDNKSDEYEFVVTFANTGQEHEKTLEFVRNCDREFGFNTIWLEAAVNHVERIGTGHKIVNFETASRNGEPFEDVIKKYGIPNMAYPHCNRELKLAPMKSYLRSIGWKKNKFITAIGIRFDEPKRIRKDASLENIVYPLAHIHQTTKSDILSWWDKQNFNLEIMEHQGNCTWCWKKTLNKHFMLIRENPSIYEFPKRMELLYQNTGAQAYHEGKRVFFRKRKSTEDLFAMEKDDEDVIMDDLFSECGESCEIYK